jgi:hypothetical protein
MGIKDSVIIVPKDSLEFNMVKYTGVDFSKVTQFIENLTYGARGIKSPDPLTQPFIKINSTQYAISPCLITGNSIERNYTILINKIPEERKNYLNLVSLKEGILRRKIIEGMNSPNFRYFNGDVPALQKCPDIDLAIIFDQKKTVLFLELKWFIAPAETREVLEKGQEIQKGISQLLNIKDAFQKDPIPFFRSLNIDENYHPSFVLVSANFIGEGWDQNKDIPVIQVDHFLRKYKETLDLISLINWLNNRQYLPIENKDYRLERVISTIGEWNVAWNGIIPIREELFI